MYNLNMNKYAIMYSINNPSFLKMLKFALSSIPANNFNHFDIILNINSKVLNNRVLTEIKDFLKRKNANCIINVDDSIGIHHFLQWLVFPIFDEYKFIIKSDVDVIYFSNTNFLELVKDFEKKDNLVIGGVEEKIIGYGKVKESYNRINEIKNLYKEIVDPFGGKFVNGGLLILNVQNFKNYYPEYSLNFKDKLIEYTKLCTNRNIRISDQNFIYFEFQEHIGYIDKKWNIRFSHKNDLSISNNSSGVLHMCIWVLNLSKFKLEKIPYIEIIENSLENKNYLIIEKGFINVLKKCKPNIWFPFRSFTKIGHRDKSIKRNLKLISKDIYNTFENYR